MNRIEVVSPTFPSHLKVCRAKGTLSTNRMSVSLVGDLICGHSCSNPMGSPDLLLPAALSALDGHWAGYLFCSACVEYSMADRAAGSCLSRADTVRPSFLFCDSVRDLSTTTGRRLLQLSSSSSILRPESGRRK